MNEEKTTALENRDGKITPVDIGQEMQKSFLEYGWLETCTPPDSLHDV